MRSQKSDGLKIVDAALKALSDHDVERFLQPFAKSIRFYSKGIDGLLESRESLGAYEKVYLKAFPDASVSLGRRFVDGPWLCTEWVYAGTHTGPLVVGGKTIPATGKTARIPGCWIALMDGTEIVEVHSYWDRLGFYRQLAVPPPDA